VDVELLAEILSSGIAGMSEKTNSAVPAASEAVLQIDIVLDQLVERVLILLNERNDTILPMPIGTNRETFRQGDDKNARYSVMMGMDLDISSSYTLEANASSLGGGFFMRGAQVDSVASDYDRPIFPPSPNR
jgi:hypothetical protein